MDLFLCDNIHMEKKLNANTLKLIAILAMTLDHSIDIFYPHYQMNWITILCHLIGRVTAPIMWFFISEGFTYTRNRKKYAMRLFWFSIISHFAYCFAFGIPFIPFSNGSIFNQTSVMWGLAWSVVVLYLYFENKTLSEKKKLFLFLMILLITFPANWSCISVVAILYIYDKRGNYNKQFLMILLWSLIYGLVSFFFYNKVYGLITLGVILIYPLLKNYNGERGKWTWLKWFFYLYYPIHLFILGIIRCAMYGNISIF